jgi:hypothetical protein
MSLQLWQARWHFAADMNGDGVFTISDVWLMAKYVYFAPGDALILSVMAVSPKLATFFEIDAGWLYGWVSSVISGIIWFWMFGTILWASIEEKKKAL